METIRFFLTLGVLLTGCGASIDPAAMADVDGRIANLQVNRTTIAAPAAGALGPMPLAAGQWVQYKLLLSNGQQALRTEKVLEQQGGAFWYEVVEDTYQGRHVEQLLFAIRDDGHQWHVELLALRTKDRGGRATQASARQLALPLVTYDHHRGKVASLVAPWSPRLPQEPIVGPAGRFEGCYHDHSETRLMRDQWVSDSWRHPSVPLAGLVRWQSNHGFFGELVAYGTSGARSDF